MYRHVPPPQEKLCPILAMYRAPTPPDGLRLAAELVAYGGSGHTSVLYTNPLNEASIRAFEETVKTVRILINTPASQVGGPYGRVDAGGSRTARGREWAVGAPGGSGTHCRCIECLIVPVKGDGWILDLTGLQIGRYACCRSRQPPLDGQVPI